MKTTLMVRLLLVVMLLSAVGCGEWSRRSSRSGLLIEPADAAKLGYTVNWATDLQVDNRHRLSSVTLLGDTLFTVESPGNLVSAISVRDGEVKWRQVIGQPTENVYPPIRDEEHVYFNNDTMFYTLGMFKGDLIATSRLEHVVETGPAMAGHFAIFGAADGAVYAHDIHTGYAKWAYQMTGGLVVPPSLSQQNVFVADSKGIYAMLRADDGELVFRGRTFGPVTAKPASHRNGIFVASHDQTLYGLNRVNGRDLWVYRATQPLTLDPVALGQTVYLPIPKVGTVAININDGTKRWETDTIAHAIGAGDDRVLMRHDGGLSWVDEDSGRVVVDVPTQPLQTVIAESGGELLLVSPGGRIHRLVPKR